MIPQVIAVVGATATGKSDLALDLAESLGGEVVNADAMQLYRGMDIGTNKLPVDERRGIAHHVLDVLEVTDEATLADYQERAEAAIADVLARGRVPVLAGGSGLYVRAALDHLQIPPTDPAVRARLEAEAQDEGGVAALRARLRSVDPAAAEAIQANNIRRIIRALTSVVSVAAMPPSGPYSTRTVRLARVVRRAVASVRASWTASEVVLDSPTFSESSTGGCREPSQSPPPKAARRAASPASLRQWARRKARATTDASARASGPRGTPPASGSAGGTPA